MIEHMKMVDDDGNQISCFPAVQIQITQGANTNFSHRCTKNMDNAVSPGVSRRMFAPVDMKCVRNYHTSGYGIVIYHTVKPVVTPKYGLTHYTLVLMHDNNASRWQVGKIYKQGEHFYTEGDADPSGWTTGIHAHFETALGHQTERVEGCPGSFSHIVNQVHPDGIFFKDHTELFRSNASGDLKGDHVYEWVQYDGTSHGGGGGGDDTLPSKLIVDIGHMDLKGVMKVGTKYKVVGVDKQGRIIMDKVVDDTFPSDFHKENGKFVTNRAVNVRTKPSTSASIIDTVSKGSSFYYDGFKVAGGYVWVTGTYNGQRAYMAWRVHNGEKYGACYFV